MARQDRTRKPAAKGTRNRSTSTPYDDALDTLTKPPAKPSVGPVTGKTPAQERYIKAIKSAVLTFGVGPAGTGKTYVAGALAAQALLGGEVDKIIITRPAVEAGESLGFLPGELDEKFAPFIGAFRGVLEERLGKGHVDYLLKRGVLSPQPLAYMRGLTFRRAFVIFDEAQNATPVQMKLFLTRIGEDARVVVNGDAEQTDITGPSGLMDAVQRMGGHPDVRIVRFGAADIVRSGLCQAVVERYSMPT